MWLGWTWGSRPRFWHYLVSEYLINYTWRGGKYEAPEVGSVLLIPVQADKHILSHHWKGEFCCRAGWFIGFPLATIKCLSRLTTFIFSDSQLGKWPSDNTGSVIRVQANPGPQRTLPKKSHIITNLTKPQPIFCQTSPFLPTKYAHYWKSKIAENYSENQNHLKLTTQR